MYSYFIGTLSELTELGMVIECGGIGYELQMGPVLASKLGAIGEKAKVYSYFHITQDNQQLFGFPDKESKKLFQLLITVNGIGPKAAMAILEVFSPATFAIHVMNNDAKALQEAKGIGKKGAERIIFDLRDKLKKSEWGTEADNILAKNRDVSSTVDDAHNTMKEDIVDGLAFLGYSPNEAKKLVDVSFQENLSLEENLKAAMAAARQV